MEINVRLISLDSLPPQAYTPTADTCAYYCYFFVFFYSSQLPNDVPIKMHLHRAAD